MSRRGGAYITPYDRLRNRVFPPSPTAPARRYYPQEEQPLMSVKTKVRAVKVASYALVTAVALFAAKPIVDEVLEQLNGRKWL